MSETVTLTEIKTTRKGRYALFCDGEFLFSVDEETLVKHDLKEGTVLTRPEVEKLSRESDLHAAREKAYAYLSMRDYGERGLYQKLCRTYDPHTCAAVTARLKELGLLNDAAFAAKLAEEMRRKGKSAAEIRNKLREKGVDRETAEAVLGEEEDETETVRGIIESGYLRKLSGEDGYRKVFAALARRGFRSADIRRALAYFTEEEQESDE